MWKGFRRELKHEDLYATPEESRSQELHKTFDKLVQCISIKTRLKMSKGH